MTADAGGGAPSPDVLVEGVLEAGFDGPTLLVAPCDEVGRDAPAWAAAFFRAGLPHRVRVASAITPALAPGEIDDIASEAASLGAALVVVVAGSAGDAAARDLAEEIARTSRRPAAVWHGVRRTLSLLPDCR